MMTGWFRKLWKRVHDDIAVYLATLGGVVGSMIWPWVLGMAIDGVLPRLAMVDLVRLLGASIVAVALAVRADQQGTPDQRHTLVALRRRVGAAFMRGWAWQAGVAALTAVAAGGG